MPAAVLLGLGTLVAAQSPAPVRLDAPRLPDPGFRYTNERLPRYFTDPHPLSVGATDNTPFDNPATDAGVTLGRVLFHDTRLSANRTVSCASCHLQAHGFGDPRRLSEGFDGQPTRRHAMSLTNARYYQRGRFFWDERADSLEQQVLAPMTDPIEMGLSPGDAVRRISEAAYYDALFIDAFGTAEVTESRLARALAQFIRALVSHRSRYDEARAAGPPGSRAFEARLSSSEALGHRLFVTIPAPDRRGAGCARCHATDVQILRSPRNIGLDGENQGDPGAGEGRFKAPSLRNVAVRAPYMHDGRFDSLREVVEHYDRGVIASPFLDMTLIDRRAAVTGGPIEPVPLELTDPEIDALIAFLHTLTDDAFLSDPRFSDPFLAAPQP